MGKNGTAENGTGILKIWDIEKELRNRERGTFENWTMPMGLKTACFS